MSAFHCWTQRYDFYTCPVTHAYYGYLVLKPQNCTRNKIRIKTQSDLDVNMDGDDDNNDKNNKNNKNDDIDEKKTIMFCLILHVHVLTHMPLCLV